MEYKFSALQFYSIFEFTSDTYVPKSCIHF